MNDELWAVHLEGPDDIIAAESREQAETKAAEFNKTIEYVKARLPDPENPNWPKMRAVACVWLGSAEGHAENCANPKRWDYD